MTHPKIIYIGPHDYDVKFSKKLGDLYGETDNANGEIMVNLKQSETQRRDTLVHEILHSLFFSSGLSNVLSLDMEAEEKIIRILSPWLLAVIQDNPGLIDYLVERK